jgi:hypothetical protein
MLFLDAARYLRTKGAKVEYSDLFSDHGRFYKVYDPTDNLPAMWLSARAVSSLALFVEELTETSDAGEEEEEIYGACI